MQGDCPDTYLCNSNGKCVKGSKCTEDDKTPNGGCSELNPLCIDGEECVCNTKDPNQPILCVERSSNMCEDPGKDGSCKCGANTSCSDEHPICEVKSNGMAECQKCSKDASGGNPGDGDGTTQGNCEMGKICHATGECEGMQRSIILLYKCFVISIIYHSINNEMLNEYNSSVFVHSNDCTA